ncbi:MAG: TonB-dependent receptor, partial [Gammaproteobacteria bacterium]|nr:TonB-dependent receptor [Gammaproteobacteria bacterium]
IERVEVLRGPQGTLYGRNTAYGAINFISRMPGEEAWFDATVGGGNFDQFLVSASGGGPLGDNWAGSLSARYKETDGRYFNAAENVDTDSQENTAVRGKLRYMGGEKFDAVLSVSYSKAENDAIQMPNMTTPGVPDDMQFTSDDLVFTDGPFTTSTPWGQLAPEPFGDRPRGETEQTIVGLTLSWDINDTLTFKSITGYVGLEDYFHVDVNGTGGGFLIATDVDSDQFTQEFQLLGTAMDERLSYIAGLFYLNDESDQVFGWNFVGLPMSQSVFSTEIDSIAVFGEASFNFTDNWTGTLGLRYTDDSKDFIFDFERFAGNFFDCCFPGFIGLFPATMETIPLTADYDEWTPRAVIEYSFDSPVMLYGSVAKGFKGAGFSAISIFTTEAVFAYRPSTNWTYAAGMKADWLGSRLRTNLEYFFSDIEDKQENVTSSTGSGLEFPVQNSGDAEIQGLEAEITAVPVSGLNLFLTGTFFGDAEYKNLDPLSAAAQAPALFGVQPQVPQVPDYAFAIGFDYTFALPGQFFGDFSFGFDYYTIDDYVTAAGNEFQNSGWDQWNGFISMGIGERWELRVNGKNLGDETNVTSGSRGLGGLIFNPPREYLFTATYRM